MKKLLTAFTLLSTPVLATDLPLIPLPAEIKQDEGHFTLHDNLAIRYSSNLRTEAEFLAKSIENATGIKAKLYDARLRIALYNYIDLSTKEGQKTESYSLETTPTGVKIIGSDAPGAFYGIQSLLQLIPLNDSKDIPACSIKDTPRFGWRGMHLDVGRHMFQVEDIKKFIDWLAFHKMNTFHWHLTEDQGWRVEIKKYPKLTEIGATRASTPPYLDRLGSDNTPYSGFYTQEEIKEIVAYAQQRHVTIVPEIDMPGHAAAAIAAYPHLGNDDIPDYQPRVMTTWGVHPYTLAPKEETFQFIDDVLTELCELFPSSYIHIGGDEAPKEQWKASKFAQSVIKREGLKDEHELQSYFIGRLDEMLTKRGRKLIGWDEIREGGLSKNATMMLWRGWEHAVASIEEGHDVVMAPGSHTYFDHYQNNPKVELNKGPEYECIFGFQPINNVYTLNPIPEKFRGTPKAKHVLGCQAQLWTEYMKTWDKVEYCAFPRIAALAEVAWSPQEKRDYENFTKRLKPTLERYKKEGVNTFDPFEHYEPKPKKGITIETSLPTHADNAPAFAADGKSNTYFWSNRSPKSGDHFTLHFDEAISGPIKVVTGNKKAASNTLSQGSLEFSADGTHFTKATDFANGEASATAPANTKSIRISVTGEHKNWLLIQEIQTP